MTPVGVAGVLALAIFTVELFAFGIISLLRLFRGIS